MHIPCEKWNGTDLERHWVAAAGRDTERRHRSWTVKANFAVIYHIEFLLSSCS